MGLRHLLLESRNGVTIQVDVAFIASLLISARIGLKPTKRTYEMICLFFQGWATEQELEDHICQLKTPKPSRFRGETNPSETPSPETNCG